MKTSSKASVIVFSIALSSVVPAQAWAGALGYDQLPAAKKTQVQNGEVASVPTPVAGKPWPEVTAFVRIASTPEEAAAVWTDYGNHKTFVPDILESKLVNPACINSCDVAYKLHLPWPIPDENYTVHDTVTRSGDAYVGSWTFVRADTTLDSQGFARFETLGTGTLMTYYAFIVPGQAGASAVSGKAEKSVRAAVAAVRGKVEKERVSDTALLSRQITALRRALGQN